MNSKEDRYVRENVRKRQAESETKVITLIIVVGSMGTKTISDYYNNLL